MIGRTVAHFLIESRLGAGGMGEVYQAHDIRLGRSVAVKVLPEVFANDPDRIARFDREAKLLGSLNHPHIGALYGLEQADGRHFLIMELVHGDTLAELIRRGPVPVEDALKIARQTAEALEAAHEQGIVHRDLKPANVKITPEGNVKVLDFGLAKLQRGGSGGEGGQDLTNSPTVLSMGATHAGTILGTAAYMSPEQARGLTADQRSDIFSFGSVLYEMLTGRQPFQGETVTDVIASVVARDPDWRVIPANLHPKLEELLRRCLAKNRRERWHAIADVRFELEAIVADPHGLKVQTASEAPRPPVWRRSIPFAATAVLVAVVAVAATLALLDPRPSPPVTVTRFPIVLPEGQRVIAGGRNPLALSPDGATIVYAANRRLYVRSMGDVEPRPIQGTDDAAAPFFSPDGRWVAYLSFSENTLKKIAIAGGAAVTLCDLESPIIGSWGPRWNSDDHIYIGQRKGVFRVSANGGKPERVITLKDDEVAHLPQLLPGGDALLFTLATGVVSGTTTDADRWDQSRIVVQSLRSGERTVLIEGGGDGRYVPTGHIVYARGATVLAVPFDVTTLQTGSPVQVIEGVQRAGSVWGGGADAHLALSNSGSMVHIPAGVPLAADVVLALADRAGARQPLSIPPGPYRQPRMSPDGKQLTVATDDGKERIVWISDLNGVAPLRRFTFEGRNQTPLWTRDGQRIVFASDRDGGGALFWQRVDGGVAERLTKVEQGIRPQPEGWSPDGKTMFFTNALGAAGTSGSAGISILSLGADQTPKLIIKASVMSASLSPDGRWLAYGDTEEGRRRPEVYVQPFPPTGEKHQITTDGGNSPLWSPDGKQLFFLKPGTSQMMAVDIRTDRGFVFGKATPLPIQGIIGDGPWRPYDITPDGKYFLVMVSKSQAEPGRNPADQVHVTLNWFEELKQRVAAK